MATRVDKGEVLTLVEMCTLAGWSEVAGGVLLHQLTGTEQLRHAQLPLGLASGRDVLLYRQPAGAAWQRSAGASYRRATRGGAHYPVFWGYLFASPAYFDRLDACGHLVGLHT